MNHSPTFDFYTPNPVSSHDGRRWRLMMTWPITNSCYQNFTCLTVHSMAIADFSLWNPQLHFHCQKMTSPSPGKKKKKAEWGFLFVIFSSVGPGKTCSFSFLHKCFPFSACIQQNKISFLFLPPPVALVFFFFFLLSFFFL